MSGELIHFDNAKRELALATDINEIKDIRDKAEVLRAYAQRIGKSLETQNQCAEIKIRAERRAGELIPKHITIGTKSHETTLSDLQINKTQSKNWQTIARIPEEEFEKQIAEIKDKLKELTSKEFYQLGRKLQQKNKPIQSVTLKQAPDLRPEDFRESKIEPNSIDLILTDPPYGEEYIDKWELLAERALDILKPSKFLIAYSGQLNLLKFANALSEHLIYYWMFSLIHAGNKQLILPRNIFCGWKPILVFQKPPFKKLDKKIEDIIQGSGREKDAMEWQQGVDELTPLIEAFSNPGEIILDPFAGSGTTLIAADKVGRSVIGIERDPETFKILSRRLGQND